MNKENQKDVFHNYNVMESDICMYLLVNNTNAKNNLAFLKSIITESGNESDSVVILIDKMIKRCRKNANQTKYNELMFNLLDIINPDHKKTWIKLLASDSKDDIYKNKYKKLCDYRNSFLKDSLHLTRVVASQFKNCGLTEEEMHQEGFFGLIRAFDKFDLSKDIKFNTYAFHWVKHFISRAISDKSRLIRMPVHLADRNRAIKNYKNKHYTKYGVKPSIKDICKALNIPIDNYYDCAISQRTISMDAKINQDSDMSLHDIMCDEDAVNQHDVVSVRAIRRKLSIVMKKENFSERDRDIIRGRFGFSSNRKDVNSSDGEEILADIAKKYDVCRERIRQIENNLLRKMRPHFTASDLCV